MLLHRDSLDRTYYRRSGATRPGTRPVLPSRWILHDAKQSFRLNDHCATAGSAYINF